MSRFNGFWPASSQNLTYRVPNNSMKHRLLTFGVLSTVLAAGVMAWQQKPVAEVTVPNPATGKQEVVSSVYMAPESQASKFASSADSATVTVKWTLAKTATDSCIADKNPRMLFFIDVDRAAIVKSIGKDKLVKAKHTHTRYECPKANMPSCSPSTVITTTWTTSPRWTAWTMW